MNDIFKNLDNNVITYNSYEIGVISDDDETIWFNAHEVCIALGYKNPKLTIINNIKKKDKIQLEKIKTKIVIKKHPHSIYINEAGLYSLIFTSRLKSSEQFKEWVTHDVLPSIRKYGIYKLKQGFVKEKNNIIKKITYYEKQIKILTNDLKKDDYPQGALLYVLDYSEDDQKIYRIGKTDDLKKRKQIYDTHNFHKKNVVHYVKINNPLKLELCVRSMLYDFRYKNKKDFYICDLKIIKDAINVCIKDQKNINQKNFKNQIGGSGGSKLLNTMLINIKNYKEKIIKEIEKIEKILNK